MTPLPLVGAGQAVISAQHQRELVQVRLERGIAVEDRHVVTCFLERDGLVLVLRRSERVGTYRGRWAGVSGFLEPGTAPQDQAMRELREEVGLSDEDVQLVREGELLTVTDESLGRRWIVHPFRFRLLGNPQMQLDWEHVEMRWIPPAEIDQLETVPQLGEAWRRVAP